MKKLLILILFYPLAACERSQEIETRTIEAPQLTNAGIQILIIDSCEYVWIASGYASGLTHKGNCKNH